MNTDELLANTDFSTCSEEFFLEVLKDTLINICTLKDADKEFLHRLEFFYKYAENYTCENARHFKNITIDELRLLTFWFRIPPTPAHVRETLFYKEFLSKINLNNTRGLFQA